MSNKTAAMIWSISGATFTVAGLIWTLDDNVPIGMMNICVGMLFIVIGAGLASRKPEGDDAP
jgi:hypothetical protein